MDVDTIKPGLDFVEVVQEAVGSCDALIAVIDREWLGASDESGRKAREGETFTSLDRARYRRDKAFITQLCLRSINRPFNLSGGARPLRLGGP